MDTVSNDLVLVNKLDAVLAALDECPALVAGSALSPAFQQTVLSSIKRAKQHVTAAKAKFGAGTPAPEPAPPPAPPEQTQEPVPGVVRAAEKPLSPPPRPKQQHGGMAVEHPEPSPGTVTVKSRETPETVEVDPEDLDDDVDPDADDYGDDTPLEE
jgi:hypothetical protein